MEKQPTENITIPMWRYEELIRAEAALKLARQLHFNYDGYDSEKIKMLNIALGPKAKCETI